MISALIDTCVWLDLAQDSKQTPLLLVVENMVKSGDLKLIVPKVVIDEFRRNRARIAKASARSLSSHFQEVKAAITKTGGNEEQRKALLAQLDDINHRVPLIGGAAEGVLDRVEALLASAKVVEATSTVMVSAADRALHRKAPCHHENKNSIADAIVVETFFEAVKAGVPRSRFAFVTHNKNDFSVVAGNQKTPHPDLAEGFSKLRSMYFISLAELLQRMDPSLVDELVWEQTWTQDPRGLSELLAAHEILWKQVWYNRHKNLEWEINHGKHRLVTREEWDKAAPGAHSDMTLDTVWHSALAAGQRTSKELGSENVGPWDDFEWGMINGKLSAIRWMLGDEWDMLDT
jgi:hypothetical protein